MTDIVPVVELPSTEPISAQTSLQKISTVLQAHGPLAIAVSGGIDSLTLAVIAHQQVPGTVMFHALSQAVPLQATARVQHYAGQQGWQLQIIDAGEMQDERYRANPVNRCYFCKHNLYTSIAAHTGHTIASGTNLDDLGDFRPGLQAAAEASVVHPFVEAEITKADIRALAALLGLGDIQDLPASPCLASRVTTGIPIDAELLVRLDQIETAIRQQFLQTAGPVNLRCRVLQEGLSIQSDFPLLEHQQALHALTTSLLANTRFAHLGQNLQLAPYVQGSAFIRVSQ